LGSEGNLEWGSRMGYSFFFLLNSVACVEVSTIHPRSVCCMVGRSVLASINVWSSWMNSPGHTAKSFANWESGMSVCDFWLSC